MSAAELMQQQQQQQYTASQKMSPFRRTVIEVESLLLS